MTGVQADFFPQTKALRWLSDSTDLLQACQRELGQLDVPHRSELPSHDRINMRVDDLVPVDQWTVGYHISPFPNAFSDFQNGAVEDSDFYMLKGGWFD